MVMWGRFDENQQARLNSNEALARSVLGPDPALDPFQSSLLQQYLELRRQTHAEVGVSIPPDCDMVVERHLRAMDRQFLDTRAENLRAISEKHSASRVGAQRPTRH